MKESKSFSVALFAAVQYGRISRDESNYTLGDLALSEAKSAAVELVRRGMYSDAYVFRTGEAEPRFRHYCVTLSIDYDGETVVDEIPESGLHTLFTRSLSEPNPNPVGDLESLLSEGGALFRTIMTKYFESEEEEAPPHSPEYGSRSYTKLWELWWV